MIYTKAKFKQKCINTRSLYILKVNAIRKRQKHHVTKKVKKKKKKKKSKSKDYLLLLRPKLNYSEFYIFYADDVYS